MESAGDKIMVMMVEWMSPSFGYTVPADIQWMMMAAILFRSMVCRRSDENT